MFPGKSPTLLEARRREDSCFVFSFRYLLFSFRRTLSQTFSLLHNVFFFAPWTAIYPDRHSTFQTKQVVFTRRDAHGQLQRILSGCAKRERCHAPSASHREQARRTRPSTSLPAPAKCSVNAARAQDNVFSMRGGVAALMKRGCAEQAPVRLERVQCTP